MEDGAFDNTDSRKCAPLRSLSAAKKDSYPLEGNAHHSPLSEAMESFTLNSSVRDQITSRPISTPRMLFV